MKMASKGILVTVLIAALVFGISGFSALAAYDYGVWVNVNGGVVQFPDQRPFSDTKAGRVYVPLRFVSEALGAKVDWNDANQAAVIVLGEKQIKIKIGDKYPVVNGVKASNPLDAPPVTKNGRTMVPLRFISETLGAKVEWDQDTRTVYIGIGNYQIPEGFDKYNLSLTPCHTGTQQNQGFTGMKRTRTTTFS